jgi:hypothetical protein
MCRACAAHLHAKEVLAGVSLQERPLGGLSLQQVSRQRHLTTGDVGAQLLADAPAVVKVPSAESRGIKYVLKEEHVVTLGSA